MNQGLNRGSVDQPLSADSMALEPSALDVAADGLRGFES
jgi:hypothetical protein